MVIPKKNVYVPGPVSFLPHQCPQGGAGMVFYGAEQPAFPTGRVPWGGCSIPSMTEIDTKLSCRGQ